MGLQNKQTVAQALTEEHKTKINHQATVFYGLNIFHVGLTRGKCRSQWQYGSTIIGMSQQVQLYYEQYNSLISLTTAPNLLKLTGRDSDISVWSVFKSVKDANPAELHVCELIHLFYIVQQVIHATQCRYIE
ncbi:Hypothetical_protein [Hexamita inflata]|uniref:Hypothetical_protein n=1 Tax=Hexamita inflata TaxID=28002 RepID=A0ABP1HBT2_9EUKA